MKNEYPKFGLIMSVYKNTNITFFQQSISSIINQDIDLHEKIIIIDGPIDVKLEEEISRLESKNFHSMRLPHNLGLGEALRQAVNASSADYIFRMDDDDINCKGRFKIQAEFSIAHPEVSVIGGQIAEFDDQNPELMYLRSCPTNTKKIKKMMRRRNAVNHVTCLIKRQDILECGNYKSNTPGFEDYELWMRMLKSGKEIVNLDQVLVKVRFSQKQYKNRFGIRPAINEAKMQWMFYKNQYIAFPDILLNIFIRILPRLFPIGIVRPLFKLYARQVMPSTKT
jgi:glycosyltransferase involved in cell wall biosynthesis